MPVEKSKIHDKELTLEQAQQMIDSKSSITDNELASVFGENFIDGVVATWSNCIGDSGPCPNDYRGEHDWNKNGRTISVEF